MNKLAVTDTTEHVTLHGASKITTIEADDYFENTKEGEEKLLELRVKQVSAEAKAKHLERHYFNYQLSSGELIYQAELKTRNNKPVYHMRQPNDENGGWTYNLDGIEIRVPYNAPNIKSAETVLFVMTELEADWLNELGYTATTFMGLGKKRWRDEYALHFINKTVVIIPHSVMESKTHAQDIAIDFHQSGIRVKLAELPYTHQGKHDVIKWFRHQGGRKEIFDALIESTEVLDESDVLRFQHIDLTIDRSIDSAVENVTTATLPHVLKQIAKIPFASQRRIYLKQVAKNTDTRLKDLEYDFKEIMDSEVKTLKNASFEGLVDIAIDEQHDRVVFLVKGMGYDGYFDYTEDLSVRYEIEEAEHDIIPPSLENMPSKQFIEGMPRKEAVLNNYKEALRSCHIEVLGLHTFEPRGENYEPPYHLQVLFKDLIAYFQKFAYLPENYWELIAYYVILTYLAHDHPEIDCIPFLLLWGEPERGKTRVGEAVTYVSYRGIYEGSLREQHLIRDATDWNATIFLDFQDFEKQVSKNNTQDFFLTRFKKGASLPKVYDVDKGPFDDTKRFNVFGPTIIASNTPLPYITESRCLTISMPNRPDECQKPYPHPADGRELKERLVAWRGIMMSNRLAEVEYDERLSGRVWDISKNILKLCKTINPDEMESLIETLIEINGHRLENKSNTLAGRIIKILAELSPKDETEWVIKNIDLMDKLNEGRDDGKKYTPQFIGGKTKALSLNKRTVNGKVEILLTRDELDVLIKQYGIGKSFGDEVEAMKSMLPSQKDS